MKDPYEQLLSMDCLSEKTKESIRKTKRFAEDLQESIEKLKKKIEMSGIKDFSVNPIETEVALKKERIHTLLKSNVVEVKFTKVDGTERVMNCTLKPSLIPEEAKPKTDKHGAEHVLPVWDVDKEDWRSFRVDNVHDFMAVKSEV